MFSKTVFTVLFLNYCYQLQAQQFCTFSPNCNCEQNKDGSFSVYCDNFAIFPTFSQFDGKINLVQITGSFPSIPPNAFAGLFNFINPKVTFWRIGNSFAPLTIDDDALLLSNGQKNYKSVTFKAYKNMTIPTKALSKVNINVVEFVEGNFDTLPENSFQNVQCSGIHFPLCAIETVAPNAFNGWKIAQEGEVVLDFELNRLTEIPQAMGTVVGVNFLYLGNNQIIQINDNAFCVSSNCTSFQTIALNYNQITSISKNAFANLNNLTRLDLANNRLSTLSAQLFKSTGQLMSLGLDNNELSEIPLDALQPLINNLYQLTLNSNLITDVKVNSFYAFSKLSTLSFDFNPIVNVENGAFNGLPWSVLNITNLPNLPTIDVLATYGMVNVQKFHVDNCPMLQNLTTISFDKVPKSLKKVVVSNSGLRSVDPSFQSWLKLAGDNYLDISYNKNFFCNTTDIAWMAPYVVCPHSQIIVEETYCGNTKLLLFAYLDVTYQPTCP